jgi:hypothetical protein
VIDPTRYRWCLLRAEQARLAALLALIAWCPPAWAQDAKVRSVSYGVEIAFGSGHADRGFIVSDRPVIQPVAWVSGHGAEVSLWSSVTLDRNTDGSRPEILEMELTREYEWRHITIGPAVTMFSYHDALSTDYDRSIEAWLSLSYDLGPFRLLTNHSLDVLTNPGAYYGEAGIAFDGRASPQIEIGGSFGAGWASSAFNADYAGVPRSALDRVSAEAWLTAHVGRHFYISPHVEFSTLVDRRVRAGPDVVRPTYVLVGLATGGEF